MRQARPRRTVSRLGDAAYLAVPEQERAFLNDVLLGHPRGMRGLKAWRRSHTGHPTDFEVDAMRFSLEHTGSVGGVHFDTAAHNS